MAIILGGLAYEGGRDIEPIRILIKRILCERLGNQYELEIIKEISPRTGLLGFIRAYTRVFFQTEGVDIAFFFTDQDLSPTNRRVEIVEHVRAVSDAYLDFCVVAVSSPHFEQWLLADENAVKETFDLPGELPVPFLNQAPKARLSSLRHNMNTPQMSSNEAYKTLALEADLGVIAKNCRDFDYFIKGMGSALKNASRSKGT